MWSLQYTSPSNGLYFALSQYLSAEFSCFNCRIVKERKENKLLVLYVVIIENTFFLETVYNITKTAY